MSDPFLPKSSVSHFFREAQLVFAVVFFLVVAIAGWSFFRFSHRSDSIPQHIQDAPVANHVGPDYYKKILADSQLAKNDLIQSPAQRRENIERPKTRIALVSAQEPVNNTKVESPPTSFDNKPFGGNSFVPSGKQEEEVSRFNVKAPINTMPQTAHDISQPIGRDDQMDVDEPRDTTESVAKSNLAFEPIPKTDQRTPTTPVNPTVITPIKNTGEESRRENSFQTAFQTTNPIHVSNTDQRSLENNSERSRSVIEGPPAATDVEPFQPVEQGLSAQSKHEHDATSLPVLAIEEPERDLDFPNKNYHLAKRGDSFWSIAQDSYGDGRYFRALYEFNRATVDGFDNLPSGQRIATPEVGILHHQFPALCPGKNEESNTNQGANIYLTKSGDTLFDIARREMGQASRYLDLIRLNRKMLPANVTHLTRLSADLRLQLPE